MAARIRIMRIGLAMKVIQIPLGLCRLASLAPSLSRASAELAPGQKPTV